MASSHVAIVVLLIISFCQGHTPSENTKLSRYQNAKIPRIYCLARDTKCIGPSRPDTEDVIPGHVGTHSPTRYCHYFRPPIWHVNLTLELMKSSLVSKAINLRGFGDWPPVHNALFSWLAIMYLGGRQLRLRLDGQYVPAGWLIGQSATKWIVNAILTVRMTQ